VLFRSPGFSYRIGDDDPRRIVDMIERYHSYLEES
jgi:hypothetical protein